MRSSFVCFGRSWFYARVFVFAHVFVHFVSFVLFSLFAFHLISGFSTPISVHRFATMLNISNFGIKLCNGVCGLV